MIKLFGLHKGLEICARDGVTAYDNLLVKDPVVKWGNLHIEVNGIKLVQKRNNIAYEVSGSGPDWEAVLEEMQQRPDCLKIGF